VLDVEATTDNGRIGKLTIGGVKVETPSNLPTNKELHYMSESPFTTTDDLDKLKFGVLVEWFDNERIKKLKKKGDARASLVGYIKRKIKQMSTNVNVLHFEFGTDVKKIDQDETTAFLKLQEDLKMNAIEVPHPPQVKNYAEMLAWGAAWKNKEAVDEPTMGIITDLDTIEDILNNVKTIDCCGIHLRSPQTPLLERIKEKLKPTKLWIHAFATPHSYRQVDWEGTLGILNNYYGIDSFSHSVPHPKSSRYFYLKTEKMDDEEKLESAQEGRFFVPVNYATPRLSKLEVEHGPGHSLSEFCGCGVCSKNTIETLLSDYEYTYFNSRAHENLANALESAEFRKSVKDGEDKEYIESKEYAKKIMG
jgi:hypothetical protein